MSNLPRAVIERPRYTFRIVFPASHYGQYNRILTHVLKNDSMIPTPNTMRCDYETSEFVWKDLQHHAATYLLHVISGLNLSAAEYGLIKN